jgi:hypothetical protein
MPGPIGEGLVPQSERVSPTGFRSLGGGGGGGSAWSFSPAESAAMLPTCAIWISQQGVTQAGTVSAWASYLGGVSATLVQGTGAAQPAYNASGGVGGRPLITFDGVDDVMKCVVTKGSNFSSFEMGIVGQRVAFAAAGDVWMQYEDTGTGTLLFAIRDFSSTAWRVTSNVDLNATSDPDGVDAHYSADAITGLYNVRKNGVTENTSAGAFTTRTDGMTLAVGGRTASSAYANIAVQALYLGPQLTADQRTYLRAALTHYTGINC